MRAEGRLLSEYRSLYGPPSLHGPGRTVTSVQRGYVFVYAQGPATLIPSMTVIPRVIYHDTEPVVQGWYVKIHAGPDHLKTLDAETREEAIELGKAYCRKVAELPDPEWIDWQYDPQAPRPPEEDEEERDDHWWERFGTESPYP